MTMLQLNGRNTNVWTTQSQHPSESVLGKHTIFGRKEWYNNMDILCLAVLLLGQLVTWILDFALALNPPSLERTKKFFHVQSVMA